MAELDVNNAVGGFVSQEAVIAPGQGIYESREVPVCRLGTRIRVGPRVFYYAHVVADTNRGLLVAPDTNVNDLAEFDNVFITTRYGGGIGSTIVEITGTATKNQFADGFLHITQAAAGGYTYGIKRNTATGADRLHYKHPLCAVTSFLLELYDPLVEAATSATDAYISGCLYKNLRGATAATDMCVSGLLPITIDTSVAPYCWVQTWGPATCLNETSTGAGAKGDMLTLGDGTTGAVHLQDARTEWLVGYILEAMTAAAHAPIFLRIAP